MTREELLKSLEALKNQGFDFIVIGGGASGLGVALDAVSRGYKVLVLEQYDFAKGTSSRSTKLAHGGVRYLAQGDLALVLEALKERGLLLRNAPHLVRNQSFIIPIYNWADRLKYTAGLKLYDVMAGRLSFGQSTFISREETLKRLPTIQSKDLKGGVVYQDGQFDDARLALALALTCIERGAIVLNYSEVISLLKTNDGTVNGVKFCDKESGRVYEVESKVVINATGVFSDEILRMEKPETKNGIIPSQGVHISLARKFLPGDDALMIPETSDGRVLFAVPWYNKLLLGTTDTLRDTASIEPTALEDEIEFILANAAAYLRDHPTRADVLSVFAGLRPLAASGTSDGSTKEISRGHKVTISDGKMLSITGGKWTTFRKMGEDTVSKAIEIAGLSPRKSYSQSIKLYGYLEDPDRIDPLGIYGSYTKQVHKLTRDRGELKEKLHTEYPFIAAQVVWSVRMELCRNIEDFLARRIRILFLNAKAAEEMAPKVAKWMAAELNKDIEWQEEQVSSFRLLCRNYLI